MKTKSSRDVYGRRHGAAVVLLALAVGCGFAARAVAQSVRTLQGHVPAAVAGLTPSGRLPAETQMRLSIGLPLRNRTALTNLLQNLFDPASASYRHFVSVDEFTHRFGPSEEEYGKVIDFAQSNGLKAVVRHSNRMLVEVTGRAVDVEKAFHVRMREYRHPTEGRLFFAPDREPSVDAGLAILHIAGMDNYVKPRSLSHLKQGGGRPMSGSGPGGTYAGNDFRQAYVPGTSLTGAGQSVGLLEFAGYYVSDVLEYETSYGVPNVLVSNIVLDGNGGITNNPTGVEQPLDIEMAISMAPGLSQVLYYYGNTGDDILNRMATDNLAKQISSSWLYSIDDTSLQIFQEFIAQGQCYFNASGDSLAYTEDPQPPTDLPYIVCVGGTVLNTSGPGGNWVSESVWNEGLIGSSGGVSPTYAIPEWQEGVSMASNGGSTMMRNLPDVALTAEGVWVIYDNGGSGSARGTSCAAPLWAGFLALANEQAASESEPPVGFITPALYAIGKSSSYATNFHDITTGDNFTAFSPTEFAAVPGYDLCTGWGTPQGVNLINALARTGLPGLLLNAAPASLTLTAGGVATVVLTETAMNASNPSVSLSISNLPSGVTAAFHSGSAPSTSILTLTATAGAATGPVTLAVTGVTSQATNTVPVTLMVLAPALGATNVSLSSAFNTKGIYDDGAHFSGGGLDGMNDALSGDLFSNSVSFNGCVFTLGAAAATDAIACEGQYVTLPSGKYSCLNLLGTAVDSSQMNQPFVVNYTDGTSWTFDQSLSQWNQFEGFPGETLVSFMAYNENGGGAVNATVSANVCGYSFALNPNKTVKNIKLPVNTDVYVLAVSLASDFSLCPSPFAPALTAGGQEVVTLKNAPLNGLTGGVVLWVTNLSSGVTGTLTPALNSGMSLLTLNAATNAAPGDSQILVTGSLNGVTHSVTLNVSVLAATPGATNASLEAAFNCVGLSADGSGFNPATSMDGNGNCYSSGLLGTRPGWIGSVFSLGTTNALNAVQCSGQTVSLPAGQFPGLLLLAASVNTSQPSQVFTVNYAGGTSASFTQSVSLWTSPSNYAGESVAASMAGLNTSGGTQATNTPANLYGYMFCLDDTKTVKSLTLPENANVIVLGVSLANAAWRVPLTTNYNAVGLAADGSTFSGGLDGSGHAYSSNLLGSAPSWESTPFSLGPAGASNVIRCEGQTIPFPPERESLLYLLAAGVNGNQVSQRFTVTYTNNSTSVFTQSLSAWTNSQGYAGETLAAAMPYRDTSAGGASNVSVALYGYAFTLDNTQVARSLTLPDNSNVVVLALTVQNGPVPVSLSSAYNLAGFFDDGANFSTPGLDGGGNVYSANELGSTLFWMNTLFSFGPANGTNTVSCEGQSITLPAGRFGSLSLLAAAFNAAQVSEPFVVNYTNNTASAFTQSFSDWAQGSGYPGESLALAMEYYDNFNGDSIIGPVNLYGYTFNLNSGEVVQSLTLPTDPDLEILAITLGNATPPPAPTFLAPTETDDDQILLTWTSVAGQSYQVRYTGDLSSGVWTNLGTTLTATTNTLSTNDMIGLDSQRFYQVLVVP